MFPTLMNRDEGMKYFQSSLNIWKGLFLAESDFCFKYQEKLI